MVVAQIQRCGLADVRSVRFQDLARMPRQDHVPMCRKIFSWPAFKVIGHVLQKDVLLVALELC